MTRFKNGERVMLEGTIKRVDETDQVYPYLIALGDGEDDTWVSDDQYITHAPAHDIGLLPEQLEAVTKERDDARDQLARVCAQVETLGAELRAAQRERNDEYNARTNAMNERDALRDAYETACAGEKSADREVCRLTALLGKRSKDARILDCVATLLAMREAP